ncbi:MAG TPA: ATP-binding protein [Rubrivivax sp.]|jgi:predicted AAA+ superfamily ATPase|nr:ATP-binding protein [Rubrivivax sp.]HMR69178.1 ATP-binding protein [Rubrivivax sp.]
MLTRAIQQIVERRLSTTPAVALLGPRQVGKTTLALAVASSYEGAVVLDMEREADRAAVAQPDLFFPRHRDRLVVLDEVQHAPSLFAALRPEIDAQRRPGRFLLLGSASGDLLRQSSESLAGRVSYVELTPLLAAELAADLGTLQTLWLRGGYPLSYLAADDAAAFQWRQDFVRTFLQRDLPGMGLRVPAETLRRFWTMLAHLQGQLFNASQLALSLGGVSHTTTARYLDTLVDTMMVRRLEPHLANVGKRLVKSPKVYVRDSGLLHALLGIASVRELQGHPVAGPSWEGFVVEQVAAALPAGAQMGFFRTVAGAEIDLVVERGRRKIGIEIKFSSKPKPLRGFWQALQDLGIDRAAVVAPVARAYPLTEGVEVLPVTSVNEWLSEATR